MNEFITQRFTRTDDTDLEPIHHEPPTLEQSLAWLNSQGECAVIALAHFNDQLASLQREKVIAKEINDALMDKNQKLEKEIKSVYDSYHNNIVAMQCCVIETEHNGHEAGYSWIWNTLCDPGLIPEPEEEWYESAQLYWNANNSDPYGPCVICGKPSNTAAHYGVSCCEEHNKQLRDKACREDSAKNEHKTDLTLKVDNQKASEQSMVPVKDDDFILVPRGILGAACSAIDKKRDAPVLLSKLRELSMSVGAMRAAPEVQQ